MQYRWLLFSLLISGLLTGCALFSSAEKPAGELNQIENVYPAPDPGIVSALETYRDTLNAVMGETVATVYDTLRFGQPESPLGNLVADAIRFRAGSELRTFVHLGIIGEQSFQLYLTPGPLTLGEIMEFMPYDNHLVVLELRGSKIAELAGQIAELGGAPVSGLRFRIENGEARGILVNSQVLDTDKSYMVATSSWAADGGDRFPALWDYTDRIDLAGVDVRKLYVDYFKSRRNIYSNTDGRIRF